MPDWKAWSEALDDRQPIYLQIIDRFRGSVVKGVMPPGERVPSIREVAAEMRVNPNTVHRAYQEMEREGLIYSQRGMGYFVTEGAERMEALKNTMARGAVGRFIKDMREMGFDDGQIVKIVQAEIEEKDSAEEEKNG